jgi:hypothetical protein
MGSSRKILFRKKLEIHDSYGKRTRYHVLMEENTQETIYQTILKLSHAETFKREEESRKWFRHKATEISKNKTKPRNYLLYFSRHKLLR